MPSPGRAKSPSNRKSGLYDACGNSLLGRGRQTQKKGVKEVQESRVEEQRREERTSKPTLNRRPTFREVEERFFPGSRSGKGKLVKSASLDSPKSRSPTGLLGRAPTPKFGAGAKMQEPRRQTKWIGRRAREVFMAPGAFEENQEEAYVSTEEVYGTRHRDSSSFMKKLFHR